MSVSVLLRPVAASSLLLAAACGGSGSSVDAGNGLANEAYAELGNELDVDELPGDVDLVDLPEPPADVPAAVAAPLTQAAAIEEEIDDAPGVERVPYEGGWAWRRDGRILRTASRDGRRVSYFRPGERTPFLVQRGEETFAYRGGRPERSFDRRGRPGAVSAERQAEAQRLAEESRREREQAERAPRRPDNRDRGANRQEATNRTGDARDGRPDRDDRRPAAGNDDRRPTEGREDRTRETRERRDRSGEDRRRDDRRARGEDSGNRQ